MFLNQVTGFRGLEFTNAALVITAFVNHIYKCDFGNSRICKLCAGFTNAALVNNRTCK